MTSIIVVLFLAAIALFLAEIFIPGWVLAIFGIVVLSVAVVLTFIQFGFGVGTVVLFVTIAIGFAGFGGWMRFFPRTAIGKKFINQSIAGGENKTPPLLLMLGEEGEALTDLRPAGMVRFRSQHVDVVSDSTFIPKGGKVTFLHIEGNHIVVRETSNYEKEQA